MTPGGGEISVSARGPIVGVVRVPASKSLTQRALALAALARGRTRIDGPLLAGDTLAMARALRRLGAGIAVEGPDADRIERALAGGRGGRTGFAPEAVRPRPEFGRPGCPDDERTDQPNDAELFAETWEQLGGASGDALEGDVALVVEGRDGALAKVDSAIDVEGAGTAMRFLTALAALADGEVTIDGDARMRQRPIGPLVESLRALGVGARCRVAEGFPPVTVRGGTLRGGEARLTGSVSSQFISALLLIAPLAPGPASIVVEPPVLSHPYIALTLALMRLFGVVPLARAEAADEAIRRGGAPAIPARGLKSRSAGEPSISDDSFPGLRGRDGTLRLAFPGAGRYVAPGSYRVPPDASSASYFFAAAAVTGGSVTVRDLVREDLQGDAVLVDHLETMGCRIARDAAGTTVTGPPVGTLLPFDIDAGATPDLVPTLAVLALSATGPSAVRNAASLRVKESDRLAALATELRKLGAEIDERPDGLTITPPTDARTPRLGIPAPDGGVSGERSVRIETYSDHRIAMAFAVAGLAHPGVRIADPGCVAKSFPGFWRTLFRLASAPS